MIASKVLVDLFHKEISQYNFKRKGSHWYLKEGSKVNVVNLQRSSFSALYYVNIDVFFTDLDVQIEFPKTQECHIRTRLSNKLVGIERDYNALFDLENITIGSIQFQNELDDCISKNIIPQLNLISTKAGIEQAIELFPGFQNMIRTEVWNKLV